MNQRIDGQVFSKKGKCKLVQRGRSKWQMVILEAGPMMEIVVFRMR